MDKLAEYTGVKTRYESMMEEIKLRSPKDFVPPDGFVIPLRDSVLVKQINNKFLQKSAGGILLVDSGADNSTTPMAGLLMAVGPECPEYLIPGQRVICNQYANLEISLYGETYVKMDARDVYGILPDEAYVAIDKKDSKEVRTEKKIGEMQGYQKRKGKHDQNALDKAQELAKGIKLFKGDA